MAGVAEIQVSRLLDERGLSAFQIKMLIWTILVGIIDGYDIGAIAFAAPHLVEVLGHPADMPSDLVLTASNIGVLFGSQLMGFVGDRYGRKTALIISNLLFGVLTFAAAYSSDLTQLTWLRFFAGFGIGGVIPNLVAINAEVVAAEIARHARDHRRRLRPHGRRFCRLCQRGARFALWLADPVSDRRHRPHRLCTCRHLRPVRIDQIHGAARKPAAANGAADRRDPARPERAAERPFYHRGRAAGAGFQSDLSVPQWAVADHAAGVAPVFAQPDGLFLPDQLDADAAYGRQGFAIHLGARRRPVSGRRHSRRAGAVLVVAASVASSPSRFCSCSQCRWSPRSAMPV